MMASYVELDENNIVIRGIVVSDSDCLDENGNESEAVGAAFCNKLLGGRWLKTSYNTRHGKHLDQNLEPDGGIPFRKNFAGIGYQYDETRDAFIPPGPPYPSWILDEDKCDWVAPVPHPPDDWYDWDEQNQQWVKMPV